MNERTIFTAALDHDDPAERAAYLDRACAGDAGLRHRVEALLRSHLEAGSFLRPPSQLAAPTAERPNDTGPGRIPAPQEVTREEAGSRIGPYRLVRPLGEGGMGTVWAAEQTEPVQRLVALKLIKPGLDSAQVIHRFEAERQALALMDHGHIARVLDAGTTAAGRPFFVMELVQGVPITHYCDEAHLTLRERLSLFIPVCQAIQHAHHKGVIHRDLKPSNLLVAVQDGRPLVKVIDFGVAKALHQPLTGQSLLTEVGQVIGTVQYMSPEQADPSALDIDTRADVYALGAVLYELLTGMTPLGKQRTGPAAYTEVLRQIREEEPPRPSTRLADAALPLADLATRRRTQPAALQKEVRGELDWIVMKCLEKDRGRRYETASSLARDLEHYLQDEPVEAGPPSRWYRLHKALRKHRAAVLTAAAFVGLLLAGVVVSSWQALRATDAESQALQHEQQARANEGRALAEAAEKEKARHRAVESATAERAAAAKEKEARIAEQKAKEEAQRRLQQKEKALAILASVFQQMDPYAEEEGQPLRAQLGEQLEKAASLLEEEAVGEPLDVAYLQRALGNALLRLGYHERAAALFTKSRQTCMARLGPDHGETLTSTNNLAEAYRLGGQLDQALALHVQTLQKLKATVGLGHHATLTTMNNLAETYRSAGRLEQALALHQQTLRLRKLSLGVDHPDTLQSMNNLAAAYREAGRWDRALPLLEEVIRMRQARYGADHPATLTSMNNLAVAYESAGYPDKAVLLHVQVLEKRRDKLGPHDPSTLRSMNNLATAHLAAGHPAKALPLLEAALPLQQGKLGPDHPQTLNTMNNLARCYKAAGQFDKAVPLFKDTIAKRTATLGADHPDTLNAVNNLAVCYQAARQWQEALPLAKQAFAGLKAARGPDHHNTLVAMNSLAVTYQAVGQLSEALALLKEALDRGKANLGTDHPVTLTTMHNLAMAYRAAGQLATALPLFEEALEKFRARLGADHPHTVDTMSSLAATYQFAGKLDLALPLYQQTLELRLARPGPKHIDTLVAMNNLGQAHLLAGQLDLAVPLLVEALQKLKTGVGANHPHVLAALTNLAHAYCCARRYADAEPLLIEWLARQGSKLPSDDLHRGFALRLLGECRVQLKRFAEAEQPLRDSLAAYKKLQPASFDRHLTASLLGAALAGQKKYAEAEPLLLGSARSLWAGKARWTPVMHQPALVIIGRVIDLYEAWGRPDDAALWRQRWEEAAVAARRNYAGKTLFSPRS
jgi:serine/threonine protein kinase/tetratricopeptide (TPR) repeat protein